jgi:8-oxo-dGTP pyrophosphatase MutT (NUDIX family)
VAEETQDRSWWIIHGERVIDDSRRAVLSIASVELPDGVRFEQHVLRVPPSATVVVLDDRDRVLLLRRHRFVIDRWVWELPGGYLDPDERPEETAAREVLEETGWRPRSIEPLGSFQPMTSMIDSENYLFLARGADDTGQPRDINEAQDVEWLNLDKAIRLTETGEIAGAGSVVGLLKASAIRARERAARQ